RRPPASAPSAANTNMSTSTPPPSLGSYFPLGIPSRGPGTRCCEHGLRVDHGVPREARQLVLTSEHDGAGGTRLLAEPTEDAAQFVDLKVCGVTLTLADLMLRGILCGPDVDGLRWTDTDTQLAAHAPFHPIRVEGEPVPALEAWLDRGPFHLRVADGDG